MSMHVTNSRMPACSEPASLRPCSFARTRYGKCRYGQRKCLQAVTQEFMRHTIGRNRVVGGRFLRK